MDAPPGPMAQWPFRKGGRVVYGYGLENHRGATHRGFESLPFRQDPEGTDARTAVFRWAYTPVW